MKSWSINARTKNCQKLAVSFLLMVMLIAVMLIETNAAYQTPRTVVGTPVEGMTPKYEGVVSTVSARTLVTLYFAPEDIVVYHWVKNITKGF